MWSFYRSRDDIFLRICGIPHYMIKNVFNWLIDFLRSSLKEFFFTEVWDAKLIFFSKIKKITFSSNPRILLKKILFNKSCWKIKGTISTKIWVNLLPRITFSNLHQNATSVPLCSRFKKLFEWLGECGSISSKTADIAEIEYIKYY